MATGLSNYRVAVQEDCPNWEICYSVNTEMEIRSFFTCSLIPALIRYIKYMKKPKIMHFGVMDEISFPL